MTTPTYNLKHQPNPQSKVYSFEDLVFDLRENNPSPEFQLEAVQLFIGFYGYLRNPTPEVTAWYNARLGDKVTEPKITYTTIHQKVKQATGMQLHNPSDHDFATILHHIPMGIFSDTKEEAQWVLDFIKEHY